MQEHGPGIASGMETGAPLPASEALTEVAGDAPFEDDGGDGDDDDSPWRSRRFDDDRPHGPLPDPDQVERQRRVEIYRRLWEQDSSLSLFVRPESPPRRRWTPANTWANGRS